MKMKLEYIIMEEYYQRRDGEGYYTIQRRCFVVFTVFTQHAATYGLQIEGLLQ